MTKKKFFDTSSLLLLSDEEFEKPFIISSVTLAELEHIKTSKTKDEAVKAQARHVLRMLDGNCYYETLIHRTTYELTIADLDFEINNDTKILSDALHYNDTVGPIEFYTNDLSLHQIALCVLPIVKKIEEKPEDGYCGFEEYILTDNQIASFYENRFQLLGQHLRNQYIIIKNKSHEVIDLFKWNGEKYIPIKFTSFDSKLLGTIKPYQGDPYQKIAYDSLISNKLTLLRGKAGSGKSMLAISYLVSMLEKEKISKIIVFCNPMASLNSAKLGFYPGSKDDKLLDSQVGNFLASKLGGRMIVEQMIQQEKLELLPFSDLRGFDSTGMNAGIYISEAQNLDKTLMKLALQRIGEDCICVIEGDDKTQVDLEAYEGNNNGMRALSQVFRGQPYYGEVTLQNCYRSQIAARAELMV